jgi:hypothetical protein
LRARFDFAAIPDSLSRSHNLSIDWADLIVVNHHMVGSTCEYDL